MSIGITAKSRKLGVAGSLYERLTSLAYMTFTFQLMRDEGLASYSASLTRP